MDRREKSLHIKFPCSCGHKEHHTEYWVISSLRDTPYLWFNCKNGSTHLVEYHRIKNKIRYHKSESAVEEVLLDEQTWNEWGIK